MRTLRRPSALAAPILALTLAASLVTRPPPSAAGEPAGPVEPGEEVRAALADVGSPFLAEREEGIARLIASLPASRPAAIAGFRSSTGPARLAFVQVLAADGSKESLDALLATLVATEDPALGGTIRRALVDHAETVSAAVAAYRGPAGKAPPRVEELSDLLRRARVEALFVSKKSRSGSTGYYRGQFDALKEDREFALHVLLSALEDRAFKWPGEFPAGSFRFLRPPPFLLDRTEMRDLAANAIAELMTPADAWLVEELSRLLEELEQKARLAQKPGLQSEEGALFDVVLTTLARYAEGSEQDMWNKRVRYRISELIDMGIPEAAASLCLRRGEYERAIELYGQEIDRRRLPAIPYYNIACAYAIWSRVVEAEDPKLASENRRLGLAALGLSVANGYLDWPWMQQDRDLDALRAEPGYVARGKKVLSYAALLEKVKAEFRAPAGSAPGPEVAPGPAMGEKR